MSKSYVSDYFTDTGACILCAKTIKRDPDLRNFKLHLQNQHAPIYGAIQQQSYRTEHFIICELCKKDCGKVIYLSGDSQFIFTREIGQASNHRYN